MANKPDDPRLTHTSPEGAESKPQEPAPSLENQIKQSPDSAESFIVEETSSPENEAKGSLLPIENSETPEFYDASYEHHHNAGHASDGIIYDEPAVPASSYGGHGGGGYGGYHDEGYADEEEGGPVKPFLDHLEDLRWVIIKSVVAVAISMIICLVAADKVIAILMQPLDEANIRLARADVEKDRPGQKQVFFEWGTNSWRIPVEASQLGVLASETNRFITLKIEPALVGTNLVLALRPQPGAPENIKTPRSLVILGPMEGFKVAIQVALYGGILIASPFLIYFIGQFIFPALRSVERKYVLQAVGVGTLLFFAGVVFCYYAVVKIVLVAAVKFSQWLNFGADQWRATEYISVVCKFMLGMGLGFELPVILLGMVKMGLMDYKTLSKFRMYFVVVNLLVSGMLTPPDPFSLILMAVPLQILYELSVLIARSWYRRDQEREEAQRM